MAQTLVKVHHDWGNNIFTITTKGREMALRTIKHVKISLGQWSKHLDDGYDWEGG
jgi:hypothetical protein